MTGNEINVVEYLVSKIKKISLQHLGLITSIGIPADTELGYEEVDSCDDVANILTTENAYKKADIYINGKGVSIKQKGASNLYNRLQRANLLEVFTLLGFKDPNNILKHLDGGIKRFHEGIILRRNQPWQDYFKEDEFKALLKYLMMIGSPNYGKSLHQADYIMEAPINISSGTDLNIFTIEEYFWEYSNNMKVAFRRQWIGQASHSEHNRAVSLLKKPENMPWIFNDIVGEPRSGWRRGFPATKRKTVYFLMIEKES